MGESDWLIIAFPRLACLPIGRNLAYESLSQPEGDPPSKDRHGNGQRVRQLLGSPLILKLELVDDCGVHRRNGQVHFLVTDLEV